MKNRLLSNHWVNEQRLCVIEEGNKLVTIYLKSEKLKHCSFCLISTSFTVAYGKHIYVFGGYNGIERKHHGEVYSLDTGKI